MPARRLLPVPLAALSLLGSMSVSAQTESAPPVDRSVLQTVVVTSQKRLEDVRKVPLSVTAIGGESLKESQIVDFTDLTRNVPNVSFSSQGGAGLSTIEIRGVSSQAGSATVGLYLDDVSLTTRNLYSQGTAEPRFFDIERVEVLRGPQGTLYGAGSLGGTLRFISKAPNLLHQSAEVRAEVSSTDHGGINSLGQAVVNLPLSQDVAALRIGVQAGHDSGYIDQVDPKTLGVISKGINSSDWTVLKAALKVKLSPDWSLTPALFYQHTKTADIDAAYLTVGSYQQYNAGAPLGRLQTSKIVREPGKDTLTVPSLLVNGDLGFADFTGLVNGYERRFDRTQDGTNVNSSYIGGSLIANPTVANIVNFLPSAVYLNNKISQTSAELRLASKDVTPGGLPITWVAGFYGAQTKTDVIDNEPVFGINAAFTSNGVSINDPAQWNASAGIFPNAFPNDNSYYSARHYNAKQNSVFGEVTYHARPDLRLIAGLRYLRSSEDFHREGDFYFAGGPTTTQLNTSANKATPRVALDWDASKDVTLYVNVAEGFRLGGANRPIPLTIKGNVDDLAKLGLKAAPATFGPDSLWSYEAGAKTRLLDNRVTFNAAIYHINWKNIQQDIYLPTAGFDFETNLGRATSDGVELEMRARVTPDLTVSAGGGYNHAVFAEDFQFGSSSGVLLTVPKGSHITGVPEYSLRVGGEYQFRLADMDSVVRLNVQSTGKSNGSVVSTDPDYKRPGYTTVDASWGLTAGRWDINLSVKNLTNNRTVLQKPNIQSTSEAFYLRPRTIGLSLSGAI